LGRSCPQEVFDLLDEFTPCESPRRSRCPTVCGCSPRAWRHSRRISRAAFCVDRPRRTARRCSLRLT